MQLVNGQYTLAFENGGLRIVKNGKTLYFNARPIYVSVKTMGAISIFGDIPYDHVSQDGEKVCADGVYTSKNGSQFAINDEYSVSGEEFKIARSVKVLKNIASERPNS